jgi:hypothetical protein
MLIDGTFSGFSGRVVDLGDDDRYAEVGEDQGRLATDTLPGPGDDD